MIRLWVNGAACVVPQDLDPEFTYNTTDAVDLGKQCSSYSTAMALPRCVENNEIFTPLFDIRTVFGSASFDIHANAPAILEVANQSTRGYVKMESVDNKFHIRFINGAGLLLDKLREMKLSDLPDEVNIALPYVQGASAIWAQTYSDLYGTGTMNEYYVLFPAFTDEEDTFDQYIAGVDYQGETYIGRFSYTYKAIEEGQPVENVGYYEYTEHQARIYRKSHLRCAAQVKHLFERIMTASGFTADYTTEFFSRSNPYWANLHMVLRQRFDTDNVHSYLPSAYMPDMSCEDFILGYCKLFGLRIEVNGDRVRFLTRREWYDIYTTINISNGIDRKKGITVKPNRYAENIYGAFLECAGDETGFNAGVQKVTNVYDGIPFKYCEMMTYSGAVASDWQHYTNSGADIWLTNGFVERVIFLPYLDSDEGGELLFRGENASWQMGDAWVMEDNLRSPSEELVVGNRIAPGAVRLYLAPEMTAYNEAFPIYAYKDSFRYNYDWRNAIATPQNAYVKLFKDYYDEVCSKNNVELSMEGIFPPATINALASCKPMVWVDGVLCRVIECVTNRINKCKLTLQKLTDKNNLVLGQLFSGYYLKVRGRISVSSADTPGKVYAIPVDTNDTLVYCSAGNQFQPWSQGDTTLELASAITPWTPTMWGHSDVARAQWNSFSVRTASGLTDTVRWFTYHADRAISYGYSPSVEFNETGLSYLRPVLFANNIGASTKLNIRNSLTGAIRQDTAALRISVASNGRLAIQALDASSPINAAVVVTLDSADGSTIYAASETITITIGVQ